MRTQLKKAAVAAGIFAVGFAMLDLAVGAIGDHMRGRLGERTALFGGGGETAKTAYALSHLTTDVLILGSSRAAYHYDPAIIGEELKMSAYNAGRNGVGIPYYYAVLRSVIDRRPPRMVILDVNPDDICAARGGEGFALAPGLKPYYYINDGVRRVCDLLDGAAPFKMLSGAFRYNAEIFKMGLTSGEAAGVRGDGFMERQKALPSDARPRVELGGGGEPSAVMSTLLEEMIDLCRAHGVRLVVAVSPIFEVDDSGRALSVEHVERTCRQADVPFFEIDGWFLDHPELFADAWHLNPSGAEIYTRRFLERAAKREF